MNKKAGVQKEPTSTAFYVEPEMFSVLKILKTFYRQPSMSKTITQMIKIHIPIIQKFIEEQKQLPAYERIVDDKLIQDFETVTKKYC